MCEKLLLFVSLKAHNQLFRPFERATLFISVNESEVLPFIAMHNLTFCTLITSIDFLQVCFPMQINIVYPVLNVHLQDYQSVVSTALL